MTLPKIRLIHRRSSFVLQTILLVGAIGAVWERQWLNAVITVGIIAITFFPFWLKKFYHVFIPPEIQVLAITFLFASLFLGEIHGYYARFWWWDIALHTGSGFLLGIVGFLLVHVLNEVEDVELHMKPGFIAFFAFLFAMGMGTLWEIFEFAADHFFGLNMQKPMLGDPSGLTDTMWDLIVDAAGAAVISILGYGYLRTTGNESFLERWVHAFIEENPQLFRKPR